METVKSYVEVLRNLLEESSLTEGWEFSVPSTMVGDLLVTTWDETGTARLRVDRIQ